MSEVVATFALLFFTPSPFSSLVARLIRPSWLRGLGIHETRQHHSLATKSTLRGAGLTPMGANRFPRFSFLCSRTSPFRFRAAHRFQLIYSLRHIWADYPWTSRWAGYSILHFDVDYLGHGPPRGHGGVELNCELNVSHGFFFVESGTTSTTGPVTHVSKGFATMWTGLVCVYSHETLVLLLSRCECVLAWLPGDPFLSRQYPT